MARVKDEDWIEVASTGQDEEALLVPPERASEARALLERREKEYLGENPEPDGGD